MSIPKTDLAIWVKLGMKRRVGEGFVATGTQVRAGAKGGHDSRCRGRGMSATCLGGSAEGPHRCESSRSCAVERLCDQTVRSGGEAPVHSARCPSVKEPPMQCVPLARNAVFGSRSGLAECPEAVRSFRAAAGGGGFGGSGNKGGQKGTVGGSYQQAW